MNRKHSVNDSKTFHDSIRFTQWMLVMLLLLSGGGDARALGFVSTAPVVVEVVEVPDPVDLDLLADFVDAAYAQHGQAAFSSAVNIHAEIASAALSLAEHHHRLTQRMGPGFEGHYVAHRQPSPKLEYVDFPYFNDRGYAPDAPLKEMVILQVSGEIGYMPVVYEAFVFRFVSPEGSCRIELTDPVFPSVSDFADDSLLERVFPDCQGPRAAMEETLLEAIPGASVTGFDASTGTLLVSTGGDAAEAASYSSGANTPDDPGTGPDDGCDDYKVKEDYGYSVSNICNDTFFGNGKWVRGGSYWQNVTCVPQGQGCRARTVNSGDDLHSSIRPGGWGYCDCCDNYGAAVFGEPGAARLRGDDGITGGHVAIARSPMSWRTSVGSVMKALELQGECGGDLDLPHHGSSASANGAFDYRSKSEKQQDKAEYGGWDALNVTDHLCLVNQDEVEPGGTGGGVSQQADLVGVELFYDQIY